MKSMAHRYSFNPYYSGCWLATFIKITHMNALKDCFNPYYSGCWLATIFRYYPKRKQTLVSILIILDVGWRLPLLILKNPAWGTFQSLLFWMLVGDHRQAALIVRCPYCF